MRKVCPALFLVFSLVLLAQMVQADELYGNAMSAAAQAMAGNNVAGASGPLDAMTANPAALSDFKGRTLELGFTSVFGHGEFNNLVNNGGHMDPFIGAVPYGAFAMPLYRKLRIGVSVTPDTAMSATWQYVDAPGGLGGTTYGLQTHKSSILGLRSAAGLGIEVSPKFFVGGTVGWVYNSNTLQAPYIFQSQPVLAGAKTLLDLHTTGVGWNSSFGAQFVPNQKFQIGVAYKSRTIIHSHGDASGNAGAQFATLGVAAPADFTYNAQVDNTLPRSFIGGFSWLVQPRLKVAFQADWINWNDAFVSLPVTLTNGTNATINSLVGSNSLQDFVPLGWKDQGIYRMAAATPIGERLWLRGGFSVANNPVPARTLTPMTAAIMQKAFTTGAGYHRGRYNMDFAYQRNFTETASVAQSGLKSGEYNNSQVKLGLHTLTVTSAISF